MVVIWYLTFSLGSCTITSAIPIVAPSSFSRNAYVFSLRWHDCLLAFQTVACGKPCLCYSGFFLPFPPFPLADLWNVLQVFNEPQWKMEILLQYFQKYIAKVSGLLIFHNKPMQFQITTKGSRFVMSSRLGSFSMMFSCCFQSEVLENPLEFEFRRVESSAPFIVSSSFIS